MKRDVVANLCCCALEWPAVIALLSRASTVRSALVSGDVIFRHIFMGSEPWAKQARPIQ